MEGIQDLRITRFIVHVVNHQTGSLDLSDLDTPTGPASQFPEDFFKNYVLYALRNDLRRRARFREPAGKVKTAFNRLLAGGQDFIAASKDIASHLYGVMSASRYKAQIKPGDIMVALFEEVGKDGAAPVTYMAILKIDPSDAVIREVVNEKGRQRVLFQKRDDRIPDVEENKIQKIAVVSPERQTEPEPHDLVILDNNIKRVGVANFFFDDFLETALSRNPKEVTEALIDGVKLFVSRRPDVVRPALVPTERLSIVDRATALLQRTEPIALDDFTRQVVEAAGRPEAQAREVRTALLQDLQNLPLEKLQPQEVVAVDAEEATRKGKTLTFLLDGGVRISGPAAAVRDLVSVGPPDAAGIYTITIETQILEIR
jgi:37-kD nucleoid-associated bacterial protein